MKNYHLEERATFNSAETEELMRVMLEGSFYKVPSGQRESDWVVEQLFDCGLAKATPAQIVDAVCWVHGVSAHDWTEYKSQPVVRAMRHAAYLLWQREDLSAADVSKIMRRRVSDLKEGAKTYGEYLEGVQGEAEKARASADNANVLHVLGGP